jgi:hypothetical protein
MNRLADGDHHFFDTLVDPFFALQGFFFHLADVRFVLRLHFGQMRQGVGKAGLGLLAKRWSAASASHARVFYLLRE